MKKRLIFILLASFLCLMITNSAFSTPTFNAGIKNNLFFQNFESIIKGENNSNANEIEVGDVFQGIANVQNIDAPGTIWNMDNVGTEIDTFTAYFAAEVALIVDDIDGEKDLIVYKAPSTDPAGILDTSLDEVFAFYVDDSESPFTGFGTDAASDIADATDGDFFWSFSLETPDTTKTDSTIWDGLNSYWYSIAARDFSDVNNNQVVNAYGGLLLSQNPLGPPLLRDVNDTNEGLADKTVDLYFTAEIELDAAEDSNWTFQSNDPAAVKPVPEPTTMLLFGTGLLGLAFLGRKKMNKS